MDLNEEQLKAVMHSGHTVVIAGPGTGKTATLVARAKYWLEHEVKANELLMLTFTRKAAGEMRERINEDLGQADLPFVGTIHSWCFGWLEKYFDGWRGEEVRFISTDEQEALVKEIMSLHELEGTTGEWLLKIGQYRVGDQKMRSLADERLREVVQEYEQGLAKRGVSDFDDLLIEAEKRLVGEWPSGFDGYRQVLVDEFQDFNYLQYLILRHLLRGKQSVGFVVGDPKQGIYGFRGGSSAWFDELEKDLRFTSPWSVLRIELDISYRSPQSILDVSGALFSQKIKLQSYARKGVHAKLGRVFHIRTEDEKTEAYWVRTRIEQLTGGSDESLTISNYITQEPIAFSRVAIFYRTYQSCVPVAKEFSTTPLPLMVYGEKRLGEYQDVRTFVRLWEGLLGVGSSNGYSKSELRFLESARSSLKSWSARSLVEKTAEFLGNKFPHNDRIRTLERVAWQFGGEKILDTLPFFLEEIRQLDEADEYDRSAESISLMSLHASKGLEFEAVFILGCEEGLLPHSRALDSGNAEEIEEERRLMYVGITRSAGEVYLLSAKRRTMFGVQELRKESRFMKDLGGSGLLEEEEDALAKKYEQQKKKRKEKERQGRLF